ncbi:MAG TPA: MFS transporter [Ktedonobacterales bacterium]|nr:MFS transporter [Ktedonobacterales bacterium]
MPNPSEQFTTSPSEKPRDSQQPASDPVFTSGAALEARPSRGRPAFRPVGAPIRTRREHRGEQSSAAPRVGVEPRAGAEKRPQQGRLARLAWTVFINRDFALLWWGQTISSVGDYTWDTALVLWIANTLARNQSWAPLAISGVIIAAALPQIVVGPIAGVFVDRWDKRKTMVIATALQAIFAILLIPPVIGLPLPLIGSTRLPTFWALGVIYADVALITICSQFYIPAQLALIKDIAPEDKEDQAQEMTQAIQGLAVVIGPPVAAALVFGVGVGWALLLNALSFVVAFAAVFAIRAPDAASSLQPGETGHFSREFRAGIGYVLNHTVLRTILVAESLTWLGFGALQTLGYFFITENLHATPSMYGWFGADFGVGAILGGLLVTFVGHRIGLERVLWVALVTSGVFVIVMSHLTSFPLALVAAFFFGVTATAIIVTAGPLAIDATERQFIGRVMAVLNPVGRLAAFLSVILAGALVSTVLAGFHATILGIHFGPVDTIFTGTGLLAVAGGVYARLTLRHATRDATPARESDRPAARTLDERAST